MLSASLCENAMTIDQCNKLLRHWLNRVFNRFCLSINVESSRASSSLVGCCSSFAFLHLTKEADKISPISISFVFCFHFIIESLNVEFIVNHKDKVGSLYFHSRLTPAIACFWSSGSKSRSQCFLNPDSLIFHLSILDVFSKRNLINKESKKNVS